MNEIGGAGRISGTGSNLAQGEIPMIDSVAMKSRLEARLAELRARQAHVGRELAAPLDADSSERAVELEDEAALQGEAALIGDEIASVLRALDRIGKGSYGECVRCGGEIAPARLAARPESALCIDCARTGQ